jgi:hypothetical protein
MGKRASCPVCPTFSKPPKWVADMDAATQVKLRFFAGMTADAATAAKGM